MVWTPRQVITRLRPHRHTASTPRRPADQLDTSPLWFWDDEPPTTPRADTRTLPIIIDQDGDPYPPVERGPHARPHRTWRRGALLGAAAAAALAVLLFSGPVAGWLQHTPTAPTPGASTTNPYLAAHPGGGPGGGSLAGTGTTAGGGSGSVFGPGPRGGPKAGGHHGHPAPGGAQPGPGLRAAPTPP